MPERLLIAVLTDATGAHLEAYFEALAQAAEVDAVVLADPSRRSVAPARQILAEKLAGTYDSPAELLNRHRPSMALVSLEAVAAPPVIGQALVAGCCVLAEKPACVRLSDFQKLVDLADSKHLSLMLALANRLNPPILEARRLIRSGKIGRIYGVEMHLIADQTRLRRASYHQSWFAKKERAGGGHLAWLGIHWLDLAMYLTGSRITNVAGFVENVGGQPIEVEDSAVVAMQFDNGTLGTLTSAYFLDRGYHSHIKIWGSAGWIHLQPVDDSPLQWYSTMQAPRPMIQTYGGPTQPSGYTPFVHAALRACTGADEPPITTAESLQALKTVFAAYEAARTGQTQEIG